MKHAVYDLIAIRATLRGLYVRYIMQFRALVNRVGGHISKLVLSTMRNILDITITTRINHRLISQPLRITSDILHMCIY